MAKILTIYFSMTGQTWGDHGIIDLKKGFTNIAAEYIQEAVGGDLYQVRQKRKYAQDHFTMIEEAKQEYKRNERPALEGFCENLDDYDAFFFGFPNWWGTVPVPVLTFLEHYDWTGKRIIPFVTSGGSGFGRALKDIEESAKGAVIDPNGLAVPGTKVEKSREAIKEWAKKRV